MDSIILKNFAHWAMLEKCKEEGIDPSNSHVESIKRMNGERVFNLVNNDTGKPLVELILTKNSVNFITY